MGEFPPKNRINLKRDLVGYQNNNSESADFVVYGRQQDWNWIVVQGKSTVQQAGGALAMCISPPSHLAMHVIWSNFRFSSHPSFLCVLPPLPCVYYIPVFFMFLGESTKISELDRLSKRLASFHRKGENWRGRLRERNWADKNWIEGKMQ